MQQNTKILEIGNYILFEFHMRTFSIFFSRPKAASSFNFICLWLQFFEDYNLTIIVRLSMFTNMDAQVDELSDDILYQQQKYIFHELWSFIVFFMKQVFVSDFVRFGFRRIWTRWTRFSGLKCCPTSRSWDTVILFLIKVVFLTYFINSRYWQLIVPEMSILQDESQYDIICAHTLEIFIVQ